MILRCACCGLPFARVERDRVFVVSMHHGLRHTSSITLDELRRVAAGGDEPRVESLPFEVGRERRGA